MDQYSGFKSQIPEDIMKNVEKRVYRDIAIFKPDTFIADKLMHSEDYHIIIPSTPPPDSYINGKLNSFGSKKIITFNPGDTILCTSEGIKKQYLSLLIKAELVNKIVEEMGITGIPRFLKTENAYSKDLIRAIKAFDMETERADSFQLMSDCLAIQIVTILLREFKTNLTSISEKSPDIDTCIMQSLEYIHTFFSANITIEDICREINVSPFHFIRTFKQKVGLSPHQYLLKVRIDEAKRLLASTEITVSETAMICGFVNLSHFSKTFKEMTGVTPLEYKKNIQLVGSDFLSIH